MRWLPWCLRAVSWAAGSRRAPQLDRIGERSRLFPDRSHLAGVLRVLEGSVRHLVLREHVLQHRTLEQRRVAERWSRENHALGAAGLDLLEEEDALVLAIRVVLRRGCCRPVEERLRELLEWIAARGHVV